MEGWQAARHFLWMVLDLTATPSCKVRRLSVEVPLSLLICGDAGEF